VSTCAYAADVLRGSSEINEVLILDGKINSSKTRGRPRKNLIDELRNRRGGGGGRGGEGGGKGKKRGG